MLGALLCWSTASLAGWQEHATLSGSLNYWYRDRDRAGFDATTKRDTGKSNNLLHATGHATLLFESGWFAARIGFDLGVHASWDATNRGAPDHEINFWNINNPYDRAARNNDCTGPWHPDCTIDGAALYRAAIKLRAGNGLRGQLGLFQPRAPTALGVNWSFAPGYYRGGEAAFQMGNWTLGAALADRYRAPWFLEDYGFRSSLDQRAGRVLSIGAAGPLSERIRLDTGFAALEQAPRRMLHARILHTTAEREYGAALYLVRDPQLFRATSAQVAFTLRRSAGPYTLRTEATYSRAPLIERHQVGHFVYRITPRFGASSGDYPIWWNSRSDFNHDREWAVFGSLERSFGDQGWPGVVAGLSLAAGTANTDIAGVDDLREFALSVFASHTWRTGPLRNASISLHATRYINPTRVPDWSVYTNLFQDENDIKVIIKLPFDIL